MKLTKHFARSDDTVKTGQDIARFGSQSAMDVIVGDLWVQPGADRVLKEGGGACSDYAQVLEVDSEGVGNNARVFQPRGW